MSAVASSLANVIRDLSNFSCEILAMSRAMKHQKGESDGPLNDNELRIVSGLLRRAVAHGQAHHISSLIAHQIGGKTDALPADHFLERLKDEMHGMTDASKRRLQGVDEWDAVSSMPSDEESFMWRLHGNSADGPAPSGASVGYAERPSSAVTKSAISAVDVSVKLPRDVASVEDWSKTLVKMKKYADFGMSYKELVELTKTDKEANKYVGWIQATYTPDPKDINQLNGVTQATDFARFLKKISWKKSSDGDFVRELKK